MKKIEFIGMVLPPNKTSCGSADGDIGVEEFIKAYRQWRKAKVGCTMCGDRQSMVYAFVSSVEGAEGNAGICMSCIDRLNTEELTVCNVGSNGTPPCVRRIKPMVASGLQKQIL